MSIGELKHRVTIQRAALAQDSSGSTAETWSTLATVYAAIKPLKGREYFAAQQVQAETTHEITIRYRADVTALTRVVFGNRTFEIQSVINSMEANRWLILMCAERT